MSNCTDLSIEFRSTSKDVLETLRPQLIEFFGYHGGSYRERYKILMGDDFYPTNHPGIKEPMTDFHLKEMMEYVNPSIDGDDVDDVSIDEDGLYRLSAGGSGFSDSEFWMTFADKYNLDFEIICVSAEADWCAEETVYINKVLNYLEVELSDDEIVALEKTCYKDPKEAASVSYDEHLECAIDNNAVGDWLRGELDKQRTYSTFDFTYTPPVVLIDCENNYLNNLKSFVDGNKDIPKLNEHLVKSGLFKTTVGTEKRKRIEVEINGVKLYADSKPAVKQRKSNVEKLKNLITS